MTQAAVRTNEVTRIFRTVGAAQDADIGLAVAAVVLRVSGGSIFSQKLCVPPQYI